MGLNNIRPGLSRIDVVVVVLIAVLAAGLGAHLLIRQNRNAERAHCAFNLKCLGEGVQNFHDGHGKRLPPSRIADGFATWVVLIAPVTPHKKPAHAEDPLARWELDKPYAVQAVEVRQAWLAEMHCPSYRRSALLSVPSDVDADGETLAGSVGDYACVSGDGWTAGVGPNDNGPLILAEVLEQKDGRILAWRGRDSLEDLKQGTSCTLLLGEKFVPPATMGLAKRGDGCVYNGQYPASSARVAGPGFGLSTNPDAEMPKNFGGYHEGLCQFIMADLKLNPLALNIDEAVLGAMARRGE